jgi:hypothetical protein
MTIIGAQQGGEMTTIGFVLTLAAAAIVSPTGTMTMYHTHNSDSSC